MRAVFLDRDGVIVRDVGPTARQEDLVLLPRAALAIRRLNDSGYLVVVVSNQTVVARGLASEPDVVQAHQDLAQLLHAASGAIVNRFYFCPHHPNATLPVYRVACNCRKPRSGLFERAARELGIDLTDSFAIGDRPSDIAAGARVGCRTILVETGQHQAPPIEGAGPWATVQPAHTCPDLQAAVDLILGQRHGDAP